MDYKKHYINLIESRFHRNIEDGVYYEKHHIIPKCWGGSNNKKNIIHLTAREHYIAHWLLYRMRPNSTGTALAFWKMTFPGGKFLERREYKVSARMYSEAKEAMAEANRKLNIGKKVKPEHLVKWSKNKNNSKIIVNTITGQIYTNSKQLWREKFESDITYSAFNYYLRGKIKGKNINRKCINSDIYCWKYKNEI
jgi:hypothetical protein